ncbi:ABC transporter ATP-binding protein [Paenalcaligenes sp. Me131]|uniref:ABC transporter ATP-binding protein n=1 Tax=Paenalcaligenes sp. Me131 TaxID=3392636 RepID=UPI003D29B4C4
MATLLTVDDAQASYGSSQVLHGVSLGLAEGEVLTLLGRNGMGKSTLLKCIMGLLPLRKGAIHFLGKHTHKLAAFEVARLGVGYVPEGRQIFPTLNVEENLVATAANRHDTQPAFDLERIYDFFPRLKERRSNMGNQLSGGEQQMLAIGRALMTNPKLLILDEATEGLAPLVRAEIWRVLGELKQTGLAMIIVDKNLKPLLELANQHVVLEKGHVVWSGNSQALQENRAIVEQYLGV